MATCRDIVKMAMQRLRQLRAGEDPTGTEAEDGMVILQSLYDTWVSDGLFGRLNDTIPSADYTAQEQDRVINDGGYTITLPLTISNNVPMGSYYPRWPDERIWTALQTTVSRPPRDRSMIEVVQSGAVQRSIYEKSQRAWTRIEALALADRAPLSDKGALGLASCLAMVWAPDFGAQPDPFVMQQAMTFKWGISARYDSTRQAGMTDYF